MLVWVGYSTPWGRGCGIIWHMHEVRRDKLWLDTNAVSASPKGFQSAAKRGLIENNPFSRSKKEKPPTKVVFFFYVVIWTRTREEGPTKFFRGRSPWKEFRTLSASEKPVRVASQPCASKDSGAAINPFSRSKTKKTS